MEINDAIEEELLQMEINSILTKTGANSDHAYDTTLVLTSYGHGNVIDRISVNPFSGSERKSSDSNAFLYCQVMNSLKLTENKWIFTKVISENTPYSMYYFLREIFSEIILNLDNNTIKDVILEIDPTNIAKALKIENEEVITKVLSNFPKKEAAYIREDMAYMGPIRRKDAVDAQKIILAAIRTKNTENSRKSYGKPVLTKEEIDQRLKEINEDN